jgi:hypothetical protein
LKDDACVGIQALRVGVPQVLRPFSSDEESGARIATWVERGFKKEGMLATRIAVDKQYSDTVHEIQNATARVVGGYRVGREFGRDHVRTALGKDHLNVACDGFPGLNAIQ